MAKSRAARPRHDTKGRPTKLTADVQTRIVQAITMGATYELAAQYGGVSYRSFNNWINRGTAEMERREGSRVKEGTATWQREQRYLDFLHAIKAAEGRAAVGWLAKIEQAANDGNWQAAAWKLERRYPANYGRRVVDTRHSGGIDLTRLSDDELRAIIDE